VTKSDSAGDLYLREDLAAPKGKGPMDRRAMVDVAGPIDNTPLGWSHAIVLMNTCMVMFLAQRRRRNRAGNGTCEQLTRNAARI
jgi:hypothetical protein